MEKIQKGLIKANSGLKMNLIPKENIYIYLSIGNYISFKGKLQILVNY